MAAETIFKFKTLVERVDSMKDPKVSINGCCPACSSDDWVLTKMIALAGTTRVETTSSGGGFGVNVGAVKAGSGVGINYQGANFDTEGTHISGLALEYQPPAPPKDLDKKDHYLERCDFYRKCASDNIKKIDEFAGTKEKILPATFGGSQDGISVHEMFFKKSRAALEKIRNYELEKAVWEITRVCKRCGESFITAEQDKITKTDLQLPNFDFVGKERHCPSCGRYQWKKSMIFYEIRIKNLKDKVSSASRKLASSEQYLSEAVNEVQNPDVGGIWSRLVRKVFTPDPEHLNKEVEKSKILLWESQKNEANAVTAFENFQAGKNAENFRTCTSCETQYCLSD